MFNFLVRCQLLPAAWEEGVSSFQLFLFPGQWDEDVPVLVGVIHWVVASKRSDIRASGLGRLKRGGAASRFPTLTPESRQVSTSFKWVHCCGDCHKRDAGNHAYRQNPKLQLTFQKFLTFKTFSREISKQENKLHILFKSFNLAVQVSFPSLLISFLFNSKFLSFLLETDNETTHLIVCNEPKFIFLNFG